MTCREAINDFLSDYLSGALPETQRAVFEEHLAICPSCVAYIETYQESVRLGKGAFAMEDGEEELPGEIPEELIQAILHSRKSGA
jgi:anti-sigma factor RsiW